MLEISGITRRDDVNVIDLVNKTVLTSGKCYFDMSQIDIAHRASDKRAAPVIVSFNRKVGGTSFYSTKIIQANHIVKSNNDNNSGSEVSLPCLERENKSI